MKTPKQKQKGVKTPKQKQKGVKTPKQRQKGVKTPEQKQKITAQCPTFYCTDVLTTQTKKLF